MRKGIPYLMVYSINIIIALLHEYAWIRRTKCTKHCARRAQILASENQNAGKVIFYTRP
jgi:hypothetical protein